MTSDETRDTTDHTRVAASALPADRLQPVLGLFSSVAIVIGSVIGSGIFIKPSQVAAATQGYVGLIITLWIVCGLVNLCGALALAELSAMMPGAGGTYVFLREAYGSMWSFAWAWAEFFVIRTGSIASLASAMAIGLGKLAKAAEWNLSPTADRMFAIGSVVVLAVINIVGTRWGGAVQNATTVVKTAFVGFLAALPFIAIGSDPVDLGPLFPAALSAGLISGIGSALSAIMWTYDGWAQLPVMAEEVRQPERNIPRALISGLLLLIVLYAGANLAYHLVLPSSVIEQATGDRAPTAVQVAEQLLPNIGTKLTLSMLLVSVFGALNSGVLTGPRVLFAAARDHRFLGPLRRIDPRFGTPALAIAALSVWSIILILAADLHPNADKPLYDVLTDYCIFGGSLFYLAAVLAVFVLRRTRPDAKRPYRAWGYPILPGIFVVGYVFLLGSMFWAQTVESTVGLSFIGLGMLVYTIAVRVRPDRPE